MAGKRLSGQPTAKGFQLRGASTVEAQPNPVEMLRETAGSLPADLLRYGALAVAVLVVAWVVWRVLRRRAEATPAEPDLTIDLDSLGDQGPPPGVPSLELYHIPVRLAGVVIAPAGRAGTLPQSPQEIDHALECLVPGLSRVAAKHRPRLIRWPAQISSRGFSLALFGNLEFPGDDGKGTPWAAIAGSFKVDGHPLMIGLVMRANQANQHGQITVESEPQWLAVLAVKGAF